jgi:hypothetical protein
VNVSIEPKSERYERKSDAFCAIAEKFCAKFAEPTVRLGAPESWHWEASHANGKGEASEGT